MRVSPANAAVVLCAALVAAQCRSSQTSGSDRFPAGRTVRIVVGYAAGGGYDLNARLVARHLGRHLPGSPTVLVENMPGAGGLVATRHLATVAAPDGLTIGLLASNSFVSFGTDSADASVPRFGILGSPAPVLPVCAFARRSGIATWDDWRQAATPPRLGTAGPGSISHVITLLLAAATGVPAKIVPGYTGSADARFALGNGELDGFCATWETLEGAVAGGRDLLPVLRLSADPIAGFPDVPDALAVTSSARGRRLLSVGVYAANDLGRVYVAPPGVRADTLATLRTALADTFADAAFLQDASAARVEIAPRSVADVEAALERFTRDDAVQDVRSVLGR